MRRKASKTGLRLEYERITGRAYSDKQWERILEALNIPKANQSPQNVELARDYLIRVQNHARLRKISPRGSFGLQEIRELEPLLSLASGIDADADDLIEGAHKIFKKKMPSVRTFRRWGEAIGVRFSTKRRYNRMEIMLWVCKIIAEKRKWAA